MIRDSLGGVETKLRIAAPVTHEGRVLLPMARSFLLRLPGDRAALLWNRPAGVRIQDASGTRWLRIPDTTRRIQIGLLAAGAATAFLVRQAKRRRARRGLLARVFSR